MPKIGIDARMYSSKFTGIGRYVYELTENLFQIDQKNEYVLFLNEPEYSKFTPPNKRVSKVLVDAHHYSLSEQTTFLKKIIAAKVDLMHFTHFNAPILYMGKSVVTIHDLTLSFFPGKKMNSSIYRLAYQLVIRTAVRKAKKVIAVSNNTKHDLQTILGTPDKKAQVIYEGVNSEFKAITDQQKIDKVLKKYNLDRPFILYTGVWRSHKNLANLIKAFGILKHQYGLDCYLVITGKKDPYYPEVEQETLSLQLENDVVFTGLIPEDDLITLYSAARLYAFPSLYEGFGLPVLEAMQCHTPVACSNASCLPEVAGMKNALFFDPKSPDDIAEKIYQLYSDPQLRDKLVKHGINRVKDFSWQQMAKETLALYQSILTPKRLTKKHEKS